MLNKSDNERIVDWWSLKAFDEEHQRIYELVIDSLPDIKSANLVDLCCGSGAFLKKALNGGALSITGVDISEYALKIAEKSLKKFIGDCEYSSLERIVSLVNADAINTKLEGDYYTHATFLFPELDFTDRGIREQISKDCVEFITDGIREKYPDSPKWLRQKFADLFLKDIIISESPEDIKYLDLLLETRFHHLIFREAYRLLKDEGYYCCAMYSSTERDTQTKAPKVKDKSLRTFISGLIDEPESPQYPYKVIEYRFVESKVAEDVFELSKLRRSMGYDKFLDKNPKVTDPEYAYGITMFLIQKYSRSAT